MRASGSGLRVGQLSLTPTYLQHLAVPSATSPPYAALTNSALDTQTRTCVRGEPEACARSIAVTALRAQRKTDRRVRGGYMDCTGCVPHTATHGGRDSPRLPSGQCVVRPVHGAGRALASEVRSRVRSAGPGHASTSCSLI